MRTVYYKTVETVEKNQFKNLQATVTKFNSRKPLEPEKIKIWRGCPPVTKDRVWGFTKVSDDKNAGIVLEAIKEMSRELPKVTWIVLDEGKIKPKKFLVSNGRIKSER